MVEEGIKSYREVGILEWINYVRLRNLLVDFVLWEDLEDICLLKV